MLQVIIQSFMLKENKKQHIIIWNSTPFNLADMNNELCELSEINYPIVYQSDLLLLLLLLDDSQRSQETSCELLNPDLTVPHSNITLPVIHKAPCAAKMCLLRRRLLIMCLKSNLSSLSNVNRQH